MKKKLLFLCKGQQRYNMANIWDGPRPLNSPRFSKMMKDAYKFWFFSFESGLISHRINKKVPPPIGKIECIIFDVIRCIFLSSLSAFNVTKYLKNLHFLDLTSSKYHNSQIAAFDVKHPKKPENQRPLRHSTLCTESEQTNTYSYAHHVTASRTTRDTSTVRTRHNWTERTRDNWTVISSRNISNRN